MSELNEDNFDDKQIEELLYERHESMKNDNRPQISTDSSLQHNEEVSKREEDIIIKRIKKNEEEKELKKKTILDVPLKDIIRKTSETTASFWEDYTIKLIETKYHYENKYDIKDKTTWSDFLMIHGIAFVEYMKTKDNILYIGIFLFIIALIIYIFNIVI